MSERPEGARRETPGYWMHETSGVLRPAVEAYLSGGPMLPEHIAAMRAYLRQWIESDAWDANPDASDLYRKRIVLLRRWVGSLTSREVIDGWLTEAEKIGIDPL